MAERDRLTLAGMRFSGRHGVLPEERGVAQPFVVDVELAVDARRAAEGDDLADTVDYAVAFERVRAVVEGGSFRLIESLAEAIAAALLASLPLDEVAVRVRKPEAPLPGAFDHVEVAIRRRASRAARGASRG